MLFYLLYGSGRTMAFTVHESPAPPMDRIDRAEALRFIKDGFNAQAAVSAPLWLAARRLWLPLALYGGGALLLYVGYEWFGTGRLVALGGLVIMHLLVGSEADTFERADLERKGWVTLGSVTGASANECERRFFDNWLARQPIFTPSGGGAAPPPAPPVAPETTRGTANTPKSTSVAGRLAGLLRGRS